MLILPPLKYSRICLAVDRLGLRGAGEDRRVEPGRALHAVVEALRGVDHERHPVGGIRRSLTTVDHVGARIGAVVLARRL